MRIRISDLHKQLKKSGKPATTVYVTHDQTEAMTMGDRICVMKLGHIMQVDTPDNLYHKPKTCSWPALWRPGDEYSPQQTG